MKTPSFVNKVVWITGASSGIGEACAYAFCEAGARVIISARRAEALARVKAKSVDPDRVATLPLDLADGASLKEKTLQALALFGPIDIVVHNGGISQRSQAKDTKIATDRALMETNYFGPVAITKALLPHMIERRSGHFVVVSSLVGIIGTPDRSGYAASKHALHGFFDSLRAETAHHGLNVTMFCPGFVQTDVSINALTGDGSPLGTMDEKTEQGMTAQACAQALLNATARKRTEVYAAGYERLAIYLMRLSPAIFARVIRRAAVR